MPPTCSPNAKGADRINFLFQISQLELGTGRWRDGRPRLDKDYEMLLDALGFEPASIDDLVDRTGIAPGSVASMMLILELQGRVEHKARSAL